MKYIEINNEKLAFFTFFDPLTRKQEITDWHKKTTDYLNIPINYIQIDYRLISHGDAIQNVIKNLYNSIDYFGFLDNDCVPINKEVPTVIYQKLMDKNTIMGGAQNSSHKNLNHPFCAASCFCISSELYKKLGEPHLGDLLPRSDTVEEATWVAQEKGYNVCLIYPRSYNKLNKEDIEKSGNPESWSLGHDNLRFGQGTQFGDLFWHGYMQNLESSNQAFINKCKEILGEKQNVEEKFDWSKIEGWFDWQKLYDEVVEKGKDGDVFVEVGNFLGKSGCYLGQKIKDSGKNIKLYCVDTFKGVAGDSAYTEYYNKYGLDYFWKFKENVEKCGLSDIIIPIQNTSEEASKLFKDGSLAFVFVDANHTLEYVRTDLNCWWPKLCSNLDSNFIAMAGHDAASYCDVPQALNEFFGDRWKMYASEGTSWIVRPEPKLTGIIASVGMADYLEITLLLNKDNFDELLIITTDSDRETQEICNKNNIKYLTTDLFYKNGAKFDRGAAYNYALSQRKYKDTFLLFLDNDIVLPDNFRKNLNLSSLNSKLSYGVKRAFCWTYNEWVEYKEGIKNINDLLIIPGYMCGFFQLVHSDYCPSYPEGYNSTEGSDIAFLYNWCPPPDPKPEKLDNLTVIHLGAPSIMNAGKENCKIPELKNVKFKDLPDLRNHEIFKDCNFYNQN